MKVSKIFKEKPIQWGFRGDPYLWQEMSEYFSETEMPESPEKLKEMIEDAYQEITGQDINNMETIVIERFKHGGLSSGGISPEFWLNNALPLLVSRH